MSVAIPPSPQYPLMAWCSVKAQGLYLCLYITYKDGSPSPTAALYGLGNKTAAAFCITREYPKVSGLAATNGTALCHLVQLYRYFVSRSSEFCRHNPLCCFSTSVCCCLLRSRLSPGTFGYILAHRGTKIRHFFAMKKTHRKCWNYTPCKCKTDSTC
jgi:hypothetical protein